MTKGHFMNIEKQLKILAKKKYKTIVFPEAGFSDRIIKAVKIISKKKLAKVLLIADESALALRFKKLNVTIINPKTSELTKSLQERLYELRKDKGLTKEKAQQLIVDPFYFGAMLVKEGYADGMVSGAEVPTATTLRPSFQIIRSKKSIASSAMFFYGKHKRIKLPIILSDPAVVPNPTCEELVEIAKQTCETFETLYAGNVKSKVAFLSYSTKGSANGELVDKVRSASEMFKEKYPEIESCGEMQIDAALIPQVALKKCPDCSVGGNANVLIVPNLDAGNILYKTIQYFGSLNAIGPILQGLNKPVNDLSRGATVHDIVVLTMITAIQCE